MSLELLRILHIRGAVRNGQLKAKGWASALTL